MDAPPLTKATVNALDFEDLVTVVTLLGPRKAESSSGALSVAAGGGVCDR